MKVTHQHTPPAPAMRPLTYEDLKPGDVFVYGTYRLTYNVYVKSSKGGAMNISTGCFYSRSQSAQPIRRFNGSFVCTSEDSEVEV